MEGRKVIGRDVEPWSWIGNRERKLVWKGWSRREWVRGREDRDIRRGDGNFSKRFPVPVCTSGRFLSSGWMKSRGKLRFKLGKGGREYRTTVAPLCASAGWRRCLIPLGIEVIRSSPPKLWKKYSEGFRPNFFRPVSRNRASPISRRTFAAADRKLSYPFGERSAAAHISRPGGEIYEEPRGIKEIKQSVYLHSLNPLPSASVRR